MFRRGLYKSYSLLFRPVIDRLERLSRNPRQVQINRLSRIVGANQLSRFGKDHNFASMKSWSDFSRAVPVRNYEDFSEYIEASVNGEPSVLTSEQPFMFATTSGTTAKPKYIPITREYLKEYRSASIASCYNLYTNYPAIASGKALALVSSATEGFTPSGVPYGAISGAVFLNESALVKRYIAPIPYDVLTIKNYQSRYYALLRIALGMPTSIIFTPNPSTVDILCRRLNQFAEPLLKDVRDGTFSPPEKIAAGITDTISGLSRPDPTRARALERLFEQGRFTPEHIWPELSLICCWTKAAASYYLSDFPKYFGNTPVADMTYCASEGRGSIYLGPDKQMLAIDSHYFEFIPESEIEASNPTIKLADQLEVGANYYILFTTSAGLYRYNLNDVIKVTGFYNSTPLIEFQYKGGNVCSFTGEKVTELQVTGAMLRLLKSNSIALRYFCLKPSFRPLPHYQLYYEGEDLALSVRGDWLAERFDQELMQENIEYRAKRESGRLGNVVGRGLKPGTYEKLRTELVLDGVADAQVKISHLNPRDTVQNYLERQLVELGSIKLTNG